MDSEALKLHARYYLQMAAVLVTVVSTVSMLVFIGFGNQKGAGWSCIAGALSLAVTVTTTRAPLGEEKYVMVLGLLAAGVYMVLS